jgi:hypothetical protein
MGTNYYLTFNGSLLDRLKDKPKVELHIGKSSGGWCFSLHVVPELGINSLRDWYRLFRKDDNVITNEYHDVLTIEQMLDVITNRKSRANTLPEASSTLSSQRELARYLAANHAVLGPYKLMRHKIDGFCIGHGTGTWDLLNGEFS